MELLLHKMLLQNYFLPHMHCHIMRLVSVCKCSVMYYTNILMNIEHAQNALKLNTYFKQTDILVRRLLQKV